jgi:hypothetical protein
MLSLNLLIDFAYEYFTVHGLELNQGDFTTSFNSFFQNPIDPHIPDRDILLINHFYGLDILKSVYSENTVH